MTALYRFLLLLPFIVTASQLHAHDPAGEIRQLKQEKQQLEDRLAELRRTVEILQTEKSSRVVESSGLRGEVRKFIQDNIDAMKAFMVTGDLLDYIGSEQVPRAKADSGTKFLLDLANKVHGPGVLNALGGYFTKSGQVVVKVLRPVSGKHVVIWESATLHIPSQGKHFINFPVSVGVEGGDVIGYYFPNGINVSYDTRTGDTRFQEEDISVGSSISTVFMEGNGESRAYSIGVFGLIE
jgi:hypothetical protein